MGYILVHTHYFGMIGPTRLMITKVKDVDGTGRNSITITHESERNINKDNKGWYKYTDIYIYIYKYSFDKAHQGVQDKVISHDFTSWGANPQAKVFHDNHDFPKNHHDSPNLKRVS